MEKTKQLKDTTIKNYTLIFNKFMTSMNINFDYLMSKYEEVIKYINKNYKNIGSEKTLLSSIIYFIKENKNYNDKIKKDIIEKYKVVVNKNSDIIKKNYEDKKLSDKEINNWDSWDNIVKLFNEEYDKIKDILKKPKKLIYKDFNNIQIITILSMYIYEPPRRSEYITIKLKNYDNNDNYIIINDKIVLNNYKTSDKKGLFIINLKLNKPLNKILKEFINLREINGFNSDYLFISDKDTNIDHTGLAHRLNKFFNKKISISMLRKIYLDENFGGEDIEKLEDLKNTSIKMGNSMNTIEKAYLKRK
jgi:integrase